VSSSAHSSSSSLSVSPSVPPSPKEVNSKLNLHLGLPFEPRKIQILRKFCKLIHYILLIVERPLFTLWENVSLSLRQKITFIAWKLYYPMHKFLLGNKTGIHPDASHEYHALTSVVYWGKLFPVTIYRMRFSLSQIPSCHWHDAYPKSKPLQVQKRNAQINGLNATYVKSIHYDMSLHTAEDSNKTYKTKLVTLSTAPGTDENIVTGYYIQHSKEPSSKVVLWLYGGAFLSGDSQSNLNLSEKMGQECNYTDIFIPNYRLLPENTFFDALFDVCLAYEYLVVVKKFNPKDITLFGISSGGGLVVRLLQRIVEFQKEISSQNGGINSCTDIKESSMLQIVPSGAVLMCPFVDYTEPKGSFLEYTKHDLIVNESVFEEGTPYFSTLGSDEIRYNESPVYRSLEGLPPLCVVVSQHECVFDMNLLLVNKARKAGVDVTLGLWNYMCHVWPMFSAFVPEARQAVDFMSNWMKVNSFEE